MLTLASSSSFSHQHNQLMMSSLLSPSPSSSSSFSSLSFHRPQILTGSPGASKGRVLLYVSACSSSPSSFDELHASGRSRRNPSLKNSILLNLIQEIEPLDVSVVQENVPSDTINAMKRTISTMLGLLPSDRFQVSIDSSWEILSKLLISSIMTGYTLCKAEYRLCLERNLGIHGEPSKNEGEHEENASHESSLNSSSTAFTSSGRRDTLPEENCIKESYEKVDFQDLGEITPEVKKYIHFLESRLSSVERELDGAKRKISALEMQHLVGEEKNDLLDYLRSLEPEKVVELSEPCIEVQEAVHSVVHGLLATVSPKMHSKAPQSESASTGTLIDGNDNHSEPEVLENNTAFHFEPLISLSRDYLARLLFWCLLLGHYLRRLEHRLELVQLLALTDNVEPISPNGDQDA